MKDDSVVKAARQDYAVALANQMTKILALRMAELDVDDANRELTKARNRYDDVCSKAK